MDNGIPAQWKITNGKLGIKIHGPGCTTEITPDQWNGSLSEYVVDFDTYFVEGTDKNFAFRFTSPANWYDIKFDTYNNSIMFQFIPYDSQSTVRAQYSRSADNSYHIKVLVKKGYTEVWVNGVSLLHTSYDSASEPSPEGKIALQASVGADPNSEVYYDNIVVQSLDDDPPAPTPFPITHFSQRDPQWKNDVYDGASSWSPSNPSFERWGCTVTAASTILDYYNIKTLPDGKVTNPGNLNAWLKSQEDGYVRQGSLNWLAVTRATKLASVANPQLPALEYKYSGRDDGKLHTLLAALQPTVLRVPGHFVTAYEYSADKNLTSIIDPFYTPTKTTLQDYGNVYESMRIFTPSHTNLGYILVTSDADIAPSLYSSASAVLGADTYTNEPIVDQIGQNSANLAKFNILEYAKPDAGIYELRLRRSQPGIGKYEVYLYDVNGNPVINTFSTVFTGKDVSLTLKYGNAFSATPKLTIDDLIAEINTLNQLHMLKTGYTGSDIILTLQSTKKLLAISKVSARMMFDSYLSVLRARKSFINTDVYSILLQDSQTVRTALQ